jgi:FMN phosphatase YigB (HAD superfamily)
MINSEKVILTDCDGVLLDWEYAFGRWMERHGYNPVAEAEYKMCRKYGIEKGEAKKLIRMFNESAWIRRLSPLRDAIKYVRKLHEEHGFVFHAITSLSNDQYSQHLRTKNLRELFGNTAFEEYIYLDTGADKHEALDPYRGTECFWVEDKPENAVVGAARGLRSLLMDHDHNQEFDDEGLTVTRVRDWSEIYNIVTGN